MALPDFTTQDAATYKASLDETAVIHDQIAGAFYVHEAATPDMSVVINGGTVNYNNFPATIGQQQKTGIVAPTVNPRLDGIYIRKTDGLWGYVAGTEAVSPVLPPHPGHQWIIVASILLQASPQTTAITNSMITDLRAALALNLLDEDDMASDSNLVAPTQQSVKAYADTKRVLVMLDAPINILSVISAGGSWVTHDLSVSAPAVVSDGAKELILSVEINKTIAAVGSFYMSCGFRRVGSTASLSFSPRVGIQEYSWGSTTYNKTIYGLVHVGLDTNGDFQLYIDHGGVGGSPTNKLYVVGYYK